MKKLVVLVVSACLGLASGAAMAASNFQDTCSNIRYAYVHNAATLKATCLRRNGTAKRTMLPIMGIGNENGRLVMDSDGPSSFQESCGNIHITADDPATVTLSAFCRSASGNSFETSIPLNGIVNRNGNLRYRRYRDRYRRHRDRDRYRDR